MATRLIVDGSFNDTVTFYQTFPAEPKEKPGVDMTILLPIDPADRINPMTLMALLDRILALAAAEKEILVVCHGTPDGLAVPLVANSGAKAIEAILHILRVLGEAVPKIAAIKAQPVDKQPDAWATFLRTLQYADGNDMVAVPKPADLKDPNAKDAAADQQAVSATYEQLYEFLLNGLAGKTGKIPPRAAPFIQDFPVTPLAGVNRAQLDQLIAKGNQVRGRLDRIDFRSCNTGRNKKALEAIRRFFGCKTVCAPNVVAFDMSMGVTVDPQFDTNFDNNVATATRAVIGPPQTAAGRQPVALDNNDHEVPIPSGDVPKTRRFDAVKTRPGDEVFMRIWVVHVHPHVFRGWLRVLAQTHLDSFVQDKINPDISRFTNKSNLPLVGLWLVDDHNVLFPAAIPTVSTGPSTGDPLAGLDLGAPDATPLPAFALPRDPEYRQHLVVVP